MKKILVVDDEIDILEIVEIILISNGFDVYTHTSGYNVPPIVTDYKPDIILLDISLPYRSGTEICKELKETHDIPILLFSARTKAEEAYKGCNADGFIGKPFDVKDLLNQINKHLKTG